MEFPTVGHHCSNSACKQLDFLPLQCKCGRVFCSNHMNKHILSCESFTNTSKVLNKIEELFECSHDKCKIRSIIPIKCDKCGKHFCITHRHVVSCGEEDSNIGAVNQGKLSVQNFKEAKEIVDKLLDENIKKAKKSVKAQETAKKVQLMRLKSKAVGQKTIPTNDQIYFDIHYTKDEQNDLTLPVFVSKTWTIGKVIDAIAQECKLKNNNNQSNSLKLRLFMKDNGILVSNNMAIKLEDLLKENKFINGDSLSMSYVTE